MAAAINGSTDSAKLLLTMGADPTIKSAKGETALDMARVIGRCTEARADLTRARRDKRFQMPAEFQPRCGAL
jgi:hypothetical protein